MSISDLDSAMNQLLVRKRKAEEALRLHNEVLSLESRIFDLRKNSRTHDLVRNLVCDRFLQNPSEVFSKRRVQVLVIPRWVAWFVLHEDYRYSFCELGRIFDSHHTAVMYGVERIKVLIGIDQKLASNLILIREQCQQMLLNGRPK